jgi:hypothetical protein
MNYPNNDSILFLWANYVPKFSDCNLASIGDMSVIYLTIQYVINYLLFFVDEVCLLFLLII